MTDYREEQDSLGTVQVPVDALWGAQTQRAIDNFPVSGRRLPLPFVRAVIQIKRAAAIANAQLGQLDKARRDAIQAACDQLLADENCGRHFPVDVFQTGSGTSSNMNANEVIATLASRQGVAVHPNDHVNMGQSSNDVIPTAIHVSTAMEVVYRLLPAVTHLQGMIYGRETEFVDLVKTGRTHLMDAMPVTLGQELQTWREQLIASQHRLDAICQELLAVPQGGTAVGTGVNAHRDLAGKLTAELETQLGLKFHPLPHKFVAQSAVDVPLALSAQLRGLAVVLLKIANDLRWMNSGPIHGLAEITLPALQPGSSIMPAKVNPVVPEAVAMVAAQVTGLDQAVTVAAQSGNFQLNVMLPLVASNLLEMIHLLTQSSQLLADKAIKGFAVNRESIAASVERNPVLVTALNPVIGYARAAEIAKEAYASGKPVREVAQARTDLDAKSLAALLDPFKLTQGGS
ncbi:MAG: class II fumarate hydratase [Marinobacter sp.]|nr:class II fumarate hydratase [Marinobacter sp.]